MSEQDTNTEGDSPDQVASERQQTDQPEARHQPPGQRPGGRITGIVAGLALVVGLSALALAAWSWRQTQARPDDQPMAQLQSDLADEQRRIDQLDTVLESVQDQYADLSEALTRRDEQLQSLTSEVAEAGDQVARVDQRLDELEQELLEQIHQLRQRDDSQREVDRELNRHLLLIEVAALLRMGQARAELAGDFSGARTAYRHSARLLAQADDPRLGQVRRLLVAELDTLEALEEPDWLAAQARLERLARQVGQWPLDGRGPDIDSDPGSEDPQEAGWMDNMRSALGQLVQVRPRDETPISQEQLELIREALRLRLAAAELALGRRDLAELDHHLRQVTQALNNHFDPDDQAVEAALGVVEELRALEPAMAPSGLGAALAGLREHLEQS